MKDTKRKYVFAFDRRRCIYKSMHSLIMNEFGGSRASMETPALYVVLSETRPQALEPTLEKLQIGVDQLSKTIYVESRIALDNRTKDRSLRPKIYPNEGLERFCQLTGLAAIDARAIFAGAHREAKFHIRNAFMIQGKFQIVDSQRLARALYDGVGSRRSYGYGLLMATTAPYYQH